jgi:hypothetical protein
MFREEKRCGHVDGHNVRRIGQSGRVSYTCLDEKPMSNASETDCKSSWLRHESFRPHLSCIVSAEVGITTR